MKTLLVLFIGAALTLSAPAIPQTFNNGFFGATGQQFEDFAIAALAPGAEMKGEWAPVRNGKVPTLQLKQTATVFGVPAKSVIAEKNRNGIEKFRVGFVSQADRSARAVPLVDRVLAGLRAYTGANEAGPKKPATYKGATITLTTDGKDVVWVEFSKAK